jgi:Ni,Fe-hydrogenase III component G
LTDATYVNEDGLTESKRIYQVNLMNFISGKLAQTAQVFFQYTDYQHASKSVGCDENGNELSTSTYTYLYSYWQQNNITL